MVSAGAADTELPVRIIMPIKPSFHEGATDPYMYTHFPT